MPYVQRSVPQALDVIDPGVEDVWSSPNVFANNVPIALWQQAVLGNGILNALTLPPDPPVYDYAPSQSQLDNYVASLRAAQEDPEKLTVVGNAGEPGVGQTVNLAQGNMPGSNTDDPNDQVGNPPVQDTPAVAPPAGGSVWNQLESVLNTCREEGLKGQWKETGSNPKILDCFIQMGFKIDPTINRMAAAQGDAGKPDQVAWCAAFAGTVLKNSGSVWVPNNLAAAAYTEKWKCVKVPVQDPSLWRRNDVIVTATPSKRTGKVQNHVCFVRGVDLQRRTYQAIGGNQGDNCTQTNYSQGALQYVVFVGRAWEVPSQYDVPIVMRLDGSTLAPVKTR